MEFINYVSALLVSYLGLAAGIALALVAEEEIKPGKKYFIAMQNILVVGIVLATVYVLEFNWLPWIVFIGLAFYIPFVKKQRKKAFLIYLLFGIIMWVSAQQHAFVPVTELFIISAALIFLAGFPTGSLLINVKKKNIFPIMMSNIHFVVIALILYLV